MIKAAIQLGQQGKANKIEIQGARYEGLTVWFNTMVNSAGGKILSPDGKQVVLDQSAVTALAEMKKLATSSAADPSLSVQMEDTNRLAFEAGTAAFELNYPFVYPSAKSNAPDIFNKMGFAPFPQVTPGQPARVTIGGIDLGVSRYSRFPQQAFEAAACLRNSANQKIDATVGGLPPTIISLYQDPEVRASYPFADIALSELQNASVRPQTPAYVNLSLTVQADLSPPSSINPPSTVNKLRTDIRNAINDKGLIP
jgi:multiple sugar transport system substrate-binding protein